MDKIQNNAMLLSTKITKFSNTRRDNGMADELTEAKKASPNVIKVTKTLFASPIIKGLNKAHGQLRNHTEKFNTLPWAERERLIPCESIDPFEAAWVKKIDYIEDLKRELYKEYPNMMKRAAKDLGDAFDINDYPTVEEILSATAQATRSKSFQSLATCASTYLRTSCKRSRTVLRPTLPVASRLLLSLCMSVWSIRYRL